MTRRLIDLSHPLEAATPPWPGNPPVEVVVVSRIPASRGPGDRGEPGARVECNVSTFLTCNHTGTHMDSPAHFYNGVRTIEQMPLDFCIGPAVLVDVRHIGPRARSRRPIFPRDERPSRQPARWSSEPDGRAAGGRMVISTITRC